MDPKSKLEAKNLFKETREKALESISSKREILEGIEEINHKYKKYIQFRDKLDCFIL